MDLLHLKFLLDGNLFDNFLFLPRVERSPSIGVGAIVQDHFGVVQPSFASDVGELFAVREALQCASSTGKHYSVLLLLVFKFIDWRVIPHLVVQAFFASDVGKLFAVREALQCASSAGIMYSKTKRPKESTKQVEQTNPRPNNVKGLRQRHSKLKLYRCSVTQATQKQKRQEIESNRTPEPHNHPKNNKKKETALPDVIQTEQHKRNQTRNRNKTEEMQPP
ncbi:hypothetical protein QYF36_011833 [Acer negundo]|nr:hypothetical protein QYF36_011833 [Acer negundo]